MPLRIGLQTKIVLLVVCGLTTIFAVFSYLALQMLNESTQQSLEERLDAAKLIAAYADEEVRGAFALLDGVASPALLEGESEGAQAQRASLGALLQRSPFFSYGVFVVDSEGRVVWSEPEDRFPAGTELPGYAGLLPGLQSGQREVSDLVADSPGGAPLVLLAVPLRLQNGGMAGAIGTAADLGSGSLSALLEPTGLGRSSYAEIVDRSGRVLASTNRERLLQRDDHADRFLSLIREKQPMVGRCYRCHEAVIQARQNDVLAFSPLQDAPWGVVFRQLEDEVLAPTREMAKRILLVATPLFAVALALAWVTTRRVVRPIRELTAASERIASGDLDFAVKPVGNDELGVLATAFDSMRVKLKASYEEIERWNRDLEQRVERRTRDLATVFEASQIAAGTLDVETLLGEAIPRLLMAIPQAGAGVLYLSREDDGLLTASASYGYDREALSRLRLAAGEGIAGKVCQSGRATLWPYREAVAAAMADLSPANAASWKAAAAAMGEPFSTIGVPLVAQGRAIGCLVLDNFRPEQGMSDVDLSLAQTIADRIAVAIENARLYEEVQRKEQLRGQLLEKVIVAQEEERKRIARELHDETGQSLTALAISLASAQDSLPTEANGAGEALEKAKLLADKLLAETRRLISDLRPTVLDDLGLVPALRRYATTHAGLLNLDVKLQVEGKRRRLSPQAETALFRIVQEALTNVAKHAQAKSVAIKLGFEERRVTVLVEDDGRGFDVAQALGMGGLDRGVGLLGMRERAMLLGGTLDIRSHPGEGTVLIISLPLEPEAVFANG